jgi:outer membrane protein assembly factor BamA
MPVRLYFAKILDEVQGDDEEKFQFSFGAFF